MKNKEKLIVVLLLSMLMLSTLAFTPSNFALTIAKEVTPAERSRITIENGFAKYVENSNIPTFTAQATEKAFANFIKKNPIYQTYLSEYANLTRPDVSKILPEYQPVASPITVEPPFKVLNTTINGHTYQVSFSNAQSADGKRYVHTTIGCGGSDPDIYIEIVPLTISILGIPIQYGEDDIMGIRYAAGGPSNDFKFDFDLQMDDATTVLGATSAAAALAMVVAGVGSGGPAAVIPGVIALVSYVEQRELTYMKDTIDGSVSATHGTELCIENYWVYPSWLCPLNIFNDYRIWVRHWYEDHDAFIVAFPHYTQYFYDIASGITGEAMAWGLSKMYYALGNTLGYNTWSPVDATYPMPSFPAGSTGLLYPVVNTYDNQQNLISVGVYIDDYEAGDNNPTLNVTPETHYVRVDGLIPTGGGYGYVFNYMTIEGNTYYSNEAEATLSTNSSITAHFTYGPLPTYNVQVRCWETVTYTQGYGIQIYVDSNSWAQCPASGTLTIGTHNIGVDSPIQGYYCYGATVTNGGGQYYTSNFADIYIGSDTIIDFWYGY